MLQGRLNMNNWSAWVYQSTCLQHCFEPNNAVTVSIVSGSTNNFCKSQLATWKTRCVWYIYIYTYNIIVICTFINNTIDVINITIIIIIVIFVVILVILVIAIVISY
jgi:hypothetical protein